jgi:hypothetical protein
MKTRNTIGRNVVVALALLLGAGAAQAQTIQTSDGGTNATGITGLVVGSATYDVTFEYGFAVSSAIYGPAPGIYTFDTNTTAAEAAVAVNTVLTTDRAVQYVGPEGLVPTWATYFIGFNFREVGVGLVDVWQSDNGPESWFLVGDNETDFDNLVYKGDERVYAVFHLAGEIAPEMALSVSTLAPLVTSGSDGQDSVGVGNPGGGTLDWTAAADESWLSLDPESGSVTSGVNSITVNYLSAGLEVGDYNATITVSAAGLSPQTIDVTLTVTPPIEVITNTQGQNATDILNLIVDDELYDVAFESDSADSIYGPGDPVFDFPSEEGAVAAVDAATKALNDAGRIKTVGPVRVGIFLVGFNLSDGVVDVIEGEEVLAWQTNRDPGTQGYDVVYTYANFQALEGPPPAPRISFSADPETIQLEGASTLTWEAVDATSCEGSLGSGEWPGEKELSGSEDVYPTETSTYLLTCTGAGGPAEAEVSVTVLDLTLGTTEVRQTKKVNTTVGIAIDGEYEKPGFPLLLPQTGITGNTLYHDGGSATFSVGQTSYTYGNWEFELRTTCSNDGDSCLVQTNDGNNTPWAIRNAEPAAGTARMVFTGEGADAFNDLVVAPEIVQVFVTSQSFPGDLQSFAGEFTGLDGADSICTDAAKAAEPVLEGAWTAWISDGDTDVVDRMFDAEFRRLDGVVVADNLADLTDGTLLNPINVDENGNTVGTGTAVWTATDADGRHGNSGTCASWTSSDPVYSALAGVATSAAADWTATGDQTCEKLNQLYCFSASKFLPGETFANATIIPIPEPSAAALGTAALTALGLIGRASRRRRR